MLLVEACGKVESFNYSAGIFKCWPDSMEECWWDGMPLIRNGKVTECGVLELKR